MKDYYDFSNARPNPYPNALRERRITLEEVRIEYFRALAEEAASVFSDKDALLIGDPEHPENADRFVLLGRSSRLRLVVVRYVYSKADALIRLASTRIANEQEHTAYVQGFTP